MYSMYDKQIESGSSGESSPGQHHLLFSFFPEQEIRIYIFSPCRSLAGIAQIKMNKR